jgi:phenylpropionate dioxygenase-like ring-hydroxylating dioxygenase large terminal subunit
VGSRVNERRSEFPEVARGVPKGLELGLRHYWYPVLDLEDLPVGKPVGFQILGEHLVAWRDRNGKPHVAQDRCPHRSAKLSMGRVLAGDIQCAWHGLRFNGEGKCTLIPWEPEDSKILQDLSITAYPTEELIGYVWAYLGDGKAFPVPPLASCVPEEFTNPDEFVAFRNTTDIWACNWLQALDGSDGYHAVVLHSVSQAVVKTDVWTGTLAKPAVPLEDRRVKIASTPQGFRGIAIDRDGEQIQHGHFLGGWKGERWTLPGVFTIPLQPTPGMGTYVTRLYQFPIDATHTRTVRITTMRAAKGEDQVRARKMWDDIIRPRLISIAGEDKAMVESLGDLTESRAREFLLHPDRDVIAVRKMIADAFLGQMEGRRPLPEQAALVHPV